MENQIDRLVNVQISIESQAVTGETYDRILVVGAAPVTPNETQEVAAYTFPLRPCRRQLPPSGPFPIIYPHQEIGEEFHDPGKGEILARLLIETDQDARCQGERQNHRLLPGTEAVSLHKREHQVPGDAGEQIP